MEEERGLVWEVFLGGGRVTASLGRESSSKEGADGVGGSASSASYRGGTRPSSWSVYPNGRTPGKSMVLMESPEAIKNATAADLSKPEGGERSSPLLHEISSFFSFSSMVAVIFPPDSRTAGAPKILKWLIPLEVMTSRRGGSWLTSILRFDFPIGTSTNSPGRTR